MTLTVGHRQGVWEEAGGHPDRALRIFPARLFRAIPGSLLNQENLAHPELRLHQFGNLPAEGRLPKVPLLNQVTFLTLKEIFLSLSLPPSSSLPHPCVKGEDLPCVCSPGWPCAHDLPGSGSRVWAYKNAPTSLISTRYFLFDASVMNSVGGRFRWEPSDSLGVTWLIHYPFLLSRVNGCVAWSARIRVQRDFELR